MPIAAVDTIAPAAVNSSVCRLMAGLGENERLNVSEYRSDVAGHATATDVLALACLFDLVHISSPD